MTVDAWTEQRAPQPGDLLQIRDEETGEVDTSHTWQVAGTAELVPAERLADAAPWRCWWSVPVQRVEADSSGEPERLWFMLAADSFVKVGTVGQ